ncbi:hypothetical protein Tter_0525 [Thermobaculum terrenum ATCC BAA-798]|uniref:Uncharacterized protein n=1 Tax=Thermobaculum terrenum (strain ATCC BAA-798 / CCMEE 7001 / YNP1) TaxID=525904 RepID=D1CET8_THET1|nr:hypothetical protein [Thermobaculum terrenum]ACZ41444.1 hypothetical protein Tter_0525 [Thermobaculum terrenum ATCC BAA-798]
MTLRSGIRLWRCFLRSNPREWVEARGTSGPARLQSIVGQAASSGPDTSLPGHTQALIYLLLITPQRRVTSSPQAPCTPLTTDPFEAIPDFPIT